MTRKHFEYTARLLGNAARAGDITPRELATATALFVDVFSRFNAAFDQTRFTERVKQCNVTR